MTTAIISEKKAKLENPGPQVLIERSKDSNSNTCGSRWRRRRPEVGRVVPICHIQRARDTLLQLRQSDINLKALVAVFLSVI